MDELDPKQLEQLRAAREKLHAKPLVSQNPAWRFCQFILCFGIVMPLLKIGLPLFLGLKIVPSAKRTGVCDCMQPCASDGLHHDWCGSQSTAHYFYLPRGNVLRSGTGLVAAVTELCSGADRYERFANFFGYDGRGAGAGQSGFGLSGKRD